MADPVETPPPVSEMPLAANGEVKAYDRLGNKVTVPKEKVGELYGMGGRVARRQEVAAQTLEDDYAKKSTIQKVAGYATPALPAPIQMALRGAGVAPMPPELEAYRAGASQAFSAGLEGAITKEGVELAAGKEAAHAFGQTQIALKEAHGGLYQAGEVAGFIGGAIAGGPKAGLGRAGAAIPGVGIGMIGGLAERGAARALAPIAARGAIGRALATGGELAARGAVEGSLYAGASEVTESMLGDHEIAADKVFSAMGTGALYGGAGGAILGTGGSLASSGVKAAAGAARTGISRALAKGTDVAAEAAADGAAAVANAGEGAAAKLGGVADEAGKAVEAIGVKPAAEVGAFRKMLTGDVSGGARDAANTLAFDALGTTRKVADKINKDVEGGTRAVGEYVNRRILKTAADDTTLIGTARTGRADELLPLIQADKAAIGSSIGDVVKASPVRVAVDDLMAPAMKHALEMASDPVRIQGAEPFRKQVAQTFEAFANGGKIVDGTMDLSEMYYARASMEKVAHEMKRGNSAAGDAMKEWLREVDSHLVDKIDEAAKGLGDAGAKDKLLGLKREYQLAASAEKAAQDGANRIAGNNIYGIREGIGAAVGLATGHLIAAIGAAVGGKLLRERGSAAGAYLLTKMADMGVLARSLKAVDDQIGRASSGVLALPKRGPLPIEAPVGTVHERAERAMRRVSEIQANPELVAERAAAAAEPYQNNAPNLAGALSQRLTSAAAFMASKMPSAPDPDPFDPHPAPKLTDAQAAEYAAYDFYCERPSRFFEEAAHGKLTFEGVEVARALMAGAFAQMQQRTLTGLAELISKGTPPPYLAQQRIGVMLGIPAVPEQRPAHMGFLQANVIGSEKAAKAPQGAQSTPKRPIPTKTQSSTLDRLEGR